MIKDYRTSVTDAVLAATGAVSSSYDQGAAGGFGENPVYAIVEVDTVFAGTETGVVFEVISSTASALNANIEVLASVRTGLAATAVTAGKVFVLGPLANNKDTGRYLGIRVTGTSGGTISSAGGYTAYFTNSIDQNINNPA